MIFLNNNSMCIVCFKPKEQDFELIKHHVSYFPEIIAFVHYICHDLIHTGDVPSLIQYQDGDSRKFYGEQNE